MYKLIIIVAHIAFWSPITMMLLTVNLSFCYVSVNTNK